MFCLFYLCDVRALLLFNCILLFFVVLFVWFLGVLFMLDCLIDVIIIGNDVGCLPILFGRLCFGWVIVILIFDLGFYLVSNVNWWLCYTLFLMNFWMGFCLLCFELCLLMCLCFNLLVLLYWTFALYGLVRLVCWFWVCFWFFWFWVLVFALVLWTLWCFVWRVIVLFLI